MKRILYLLLGIVIITYACQTNSELTDSDKEAIVQAVQEASQGYWTAIGQTYDNESPGEIKKYFDENADIIWQTEPVAFVLNTSITNKQADWLEMFETIIMNRISTPCTILETYYSVISHDKVLEVIKGDASYMEKDSTVVGPFKYVNTALWANINGEWKMQFNHQSTDN
ncbi:MAG: hypothetical protein U9N72_08650 [Bacteroidota bacterium]|nr:hypothetical protein [Bacteroidota bacterium]